MAILKDAINALDPAPDQKNELTLLLSLLSELCEQQVARFSKELEDELRTAGTNSENTTIPVTEILARHEEYRAYVKDDESKIRTEVGDAVKLFISGNATDIIDGVANLVTTGLTAILGAGDATSQEMTPYYIIVQDFGIARYDIRAWSRQIEVDSIRTDIENALAIVAFKSSVDVTKITLNTFLIAYAEQLARMNIPPEKQSEYIEQAQAIYNKLRGEALRSAPSPNVAFVAQPNDSKPFAVANFHTPGRFRGSLWR